MDDDRIWSFERSLWVEGPENYHEKIDEQCLMVLPQPPFVYSGQQAIDAVSNTPVWDEVEFFEQQVIRPQEGLIVIAYRARATRAENSYEAHCTTTMRWLSHEVWRVVQHQQTPPLAASAAA